MNKSELIEAVATAAELTKVDAAKAIDAFVGTIVQAVANDGDNVSLVGFGTFKASERAAREGKNQTGES